MTESSAQLEREAERRRAELSATLDELRERITPGQLVDQTLDYVREGSVGELARNLARDARDNPLPLVLIGAGIAWLMVANGRRSASAAASDTGSDATQTMANAGEKAREAAAGATRGFGSDPTSPRRGFLDFVRDEPLLLAGVGLALGAAVGAVLPSTRAQNRPAGEASDEPTGEADHAGSTAQSASPQAGNGAERQGLDGMYPVAEAAESSVVPAAPSEPSRR